MTMLPPAFASVMRRVFALAAIVMLTGFLPLAASAGLCTARPCCRGHVQTSDVSLGAHPACCNETNCETAAPDTEATFHAKRAVNHFPVVATALVAGVVSNHPVANSIERFNVGSPPTQRRLAALSILLI